MVGIYKITNRETGECYIGQSKRIERRVRDHFAKWIATHSKHFADDIAKYGRSGFDIEVIEECKPDELLDRERYWIGKLSPGYNVIFDGHIVSDETRSKISKTLTGRKRPREIVARQRAAILKRHETIPQTNAGHMKKVAAAVDGEVITFESVKATAEFFSVDPSTVSSAIKRRIKVRKHAVWFVV